MKKSLKQLNSFFDTKVIADCELAAGALLRRNIVAIPTETVYGLAGNAFDESVVKKIFEAKERPSFDPLIVHVPQSWLSLCELTRRGIIAGDILSPEMFSAASLIFNTFMPGPLTLLLPKGIKIPSVVTSGRPLVGIRSPSHPIAKCLLEMVELPLAAPSANRFGRTSPTRAQHVLYELKEKIPLILDGGPCVVGLESTVVVLNPDASVSILRLGAITKKHFEEVGLEVSKLGEREKVSAPGTLDRHYAPEKPLFYPQSASEFATLTEISHAETFKVLLTDEAILESPDWLERLSPFIAQHKVIRIGKNQSDAIDAASSLFATLHDFNLNSKLNALIATPVMRPDGLWPAIHDRLTRAATRKVIDPK